MCLADIALTRRTYKRDGQFAAGIPIALRPDLNRIGLRLGISVMAAGHVGIAASQSDVSANRFIMSATTPATGITDAFRQFDLYMDYRSDPATIGGELWLSCSGSTGYYIETVLTEDAAREVEQYLKEMRAKYGSK